MQRTEINLETGEIEVHDLTSDEIADNAAIAALSAPAQPVAIVDPVDKLKAFLVRNPDVAALIR